MSELTAAHSTLEKAREVTNCPADVDLQDHLKALVAEIFALKNVDNWMSRSDVGYAAQNSAYESGANADEALRAGMLAIINDISTTTTDSILRETEARGVEKFASDQREIAEHWKAKIGNTIWIERSLAIAEEAEAFAQYLRVVKA
ncbi:hypothetical protein HmCmsJML116_03842 [Escherichia coli]|uniref:hypothetical protein n=1 Tax=Escherichia coli TaxID=562 RepID=UPI0010CB56E9|nr:hypothetical protein [Escherichia coli]GCW61636.1 hypothetical protein HmCmsJML116_03842 [Escherichia coli]GCZ62911.1 hypothetical protein HmCmsJML136_02804 [Escherichia coli]